MQLIKEFRDRTKGLPDLLNYAAVVDDGIVLNKDGSLMAGFFYRGNDISSSTNYEREFVSAKVNASLANLGNGWMTHNDSIRIYASEYPDKSESFFPNPITQLIDNERRETFQNEGDHFESVYVLILTFLPPAERNSKISEMMFDDDVDRSKGIASKTLQYFKDSISHIEDSLSAVVQIQRMIGRKYIDEAGYEHTNEELLQYLNYAITGNNIPINLPPCPMYIDSIIGGHDLWGGVTPKINNKYISIVAIDGFPQESYPGILSSLDQIPIQYRWSTRFIFMDSVEAIGHLKKYRKKWQQKIRGFTDQVFKTEKGVVDQDALEMVGETDSAIAEASSNLVAYGYYTSVIVFMDEDREKLKTYEDYAKKMIENLGFSCRVESVNALEAWLGSLPGHAKENVRRPLMHTMNLADMLPLASIWAGNEHCPCPFYPEKSPPLFYAATEGATPLRVNLHVGDLGHTLIFGPPGAGKSTLLALIAAQFMRYKDASIFCFDKGYSQYALAKACGANHFELGGDSKDLAFCPFAHIESKADKAWAEDWVEMLLELQGVKVTHEHRIAIHKAMDLLCADSDSRSRTITNFVTNLQDLKLREALKYYTLDGAMGDLLDSDVDKLSLGGYQVFEIEELMKLGEKIVIPLLRYLFYRIEKSLKGQPAMLILDEAWLMLSHPVFKEKIREWLKVLRKANCIVVLATQSLSDAARSGILDVLQEACPTKIYLPNEEAFKAGTAENPGPKDLYQILGLNDRQIQIISHATKKRDYYLVTPEGRRIFNLQLGSAALSFLAVSDKLEINRIRYLEEKHGSEWPYQWMNEKGVSYENLL